MAIQHWTIAKLVGPASVEVARSFTKWSRQRKTEDANLWSTTQWPRLTRQKVARLLNQLHEHRDESPVVYYSHHVDLWSSAGEFRILLPVRMQCVICELGEVWCCRLPDRGRLVRRARARISRAQFPETAWLATRVIEAALAYESLWREAVLLIVRRSLTGSPSDEQLLKSASTMPKWLRRSG